MKTFRRPTLRFGLMLATLICVQARSAEIIGDNFNVTGSGSGFGLNAGINSGINPPTTRLTGAAASGLRYINTGTKATTAYTITSNKLRVTSAATPGRFVLSADGTTPYDFSSALGTALATPTTPVVYDISISMDNDSAGILRFSFALGTAESDAFSWDFGFQVYRAASGNNFYTIGKRIDTASSGLAADLNSAVLTMGANTYGTEITILMRVTDAGAETSGFHSRVQLSTNGGSTWFYDTATDSDLATTGFRFDGAGRVFIWDVAPDAGNVTYDNFSVNWVSGPRTWTGAGTTGNWSTGANWGSVPPVNGSTLTFNGTTRQTNTNDISSLTVPWLKFNNSGFALYGNALTINSAITNVTGTSTLNNAVTLGGALKIQSDAGTLTLGGNVTGGAQNLTVDGAGNTTASGAISGTGSLTKNGAGVLTLSGTSANTLSGNTVVNAGTLSLAKSGVNAIAGNVTIGDGTGTDTVQLGAADQINDSSAVTISAGGVLNLNGFNETVFSVSSASASSSISLGSGTLTVGDGNSAAFAGTISGTGSLIKQGAGTQTLSGANSFSGGVSLNAGTLVMASDTALGTGTLTINGGTLNASGSRVLGNAVSVGNNFTIGGAATLTLNGNADLGSSTRILTVNNTAATTVAGMLSGTGGLTKDGTGTLQLTGTSANTYSGGTLVNGGILTLGKTAGVNGIAGNVTIGDGVGTDELQLNADNQIPDTAALTLAAGGLFDLNGFSETIGSVSSASGTSQITLGAGTLTVGDANSTTYAGSIAGTGNVVKQGAGKLTLTGASTYTGTTTISAGAVNVQNATALGTSGATTVNSGAALEVQGSIAVSSLPLTVNDTGISAGGSLRNISGNNSWSGAVTLGSDARINSDSGTLTLSGGIGGSGKNLTIGGSGNTTVSGVIATSAGTLTTDGSGTLTLSGANTYTGNTTISAGTLALGVGGSIGSSPNITIANGATFNVSAVSYSLGASQTIVRNATSGSGSVNGSMTLAAGAKISLQANNAGSVGTLAVTGNLTLNANVITVNVTGGTLGLGTYTLLTYTGTKTGSFSSTPTITGSGLAVGLAARIVESAGTISLKVYLPAHGVAAANIKVVENNLANTVDSVTVTTTTSINGLQVRDGSSRGDYTVQVGTSATDDLANGVMLTSVSQNGRDNGEDSGINYCTASLSSTASGYFIPTASAPDGKEYNINVAAAYFPYNKWLGGYARNSAGTAGGANDLLTSSSGINLGTQFVDNSGGVSTINLTNLGINSQTDGVLLATAGANDDNFASVFANANGTWTVRVKDNGTNGAAWEQDPVAFVYIPKNNVSVISGKFQGDGTPLIYSGSSPAFSVSNPSTGTWQLTIPGYSPANGVLIVTPEGGDGTSQDNIMSYQASGNNWLIQSRDIPGNGLQALTGPVCSFVFIPGPSASLVSPAMNANISSAPTLKVNVSNTVPGNVTVTFYGHEAPKAGPGKDFLIPVLPDTQNYAREAAGSGDATKEMWFAQTDWINDHAISDNIPFVATLGDCVNNADVVSQWRNATNAMYRLEQQTASQLLEGVPYGITVGNHDQDPNGDLDGSTALYNQYFGTSHFNGKSYYGGNYDANNDSWFDLFSVGGMDFIVFSFEFGRYGSFIMDWANDVLATNSTRRVIVLTHYAGDDNSDVNATSTPFSTQGAAIYDALKSNPNFFLMMSGHVFNEGGEGRRADTFNGKTVRTLVSDYQGRFNGGNGLMRLMYFSPSNNTVSVKTYSPYTGNFETDANSQFSFSYNMQPNGAGTAGTAYTAIKTNTNVTPGSQSSFVWNTLSASKPYEWYVVVTTDEGDYGTSSEFAFKTTSSYARPEGVADANGNGLPDDWEAKQGVSDPNADPDGDGQSNYAEYLANTDPFNADSVFRITDVKSKDDGEFRISWTSVGGVRYRIQYSDTAGGDFTDIARPVESETDAAPQGATSTQSYIDTTVPANGVRYYRIKIIH